MRARTRLTPRGGGGVVAPKAEPRSAVSVRCIAEPTSYVFVFLNPEQREVSNDYVQLIALARLIVGDAAGAVVVLAVTPSPALGEYGVDRMLQIPEVAAPNYPPERYAAFVIEAVHQYSPRHVLFLEEPLSGDVARRVAAALEVQPATRVRAFGETSVRLESAQPDVELEGPLPLIACVLPDALTNLPTPVAGEARLLPRIASGGDTAVRDRGQVSKDPSEIPLTEARIVLCGGRGVKDWDLFRTLAGALNAVPAATRVVCDAGDMPRQAQIGVSGTVVSAPCYLGIGVSGAIQHVQGIEDCGAVVAVNTDPYAPIMKRADLAIVGDAQAIMRSLAECLHT
jgi:electron transfer flavoprotein alpha subunit